MNNYKAVMWVFGYASLIWKVDFPYEKKLVGYIRGYVRRFWQGSEDHRGVPGKPGRVATLVSSDDPEDCVWGVAYQIRDDNVDTVLSYLNDREKDGYNQTVVKFHPKGNIEPFNLRLYIGSERNPFFLGPAPIKDIAKQIYNAEGPSGKNIDYLLNLTKALRALAPDVHDRHLFALEVEVNNIAKQNNQLM